MKDMIIDRLVLSIAAGPNLPDGAVRERLRGRRGAAVISRRALFIADRVSSGLPIVFNYIHLSHERVREQTAITLRLYSPRSLVVHCMKARPIS